MKKDKKKDASLREARRVYSKLLRRAYSREFSEPQVDAEKNVLYIDQLIERLNENGITWNDFLRQFYENPTHIESEI